MSESEYMFLTIFFCKLSLSWWFLPLLNYVWRTEWKSYLFMTVSKRSLGTNSITPENDWTFVFVVKSVPCWLQILVIFCGPGSVKVTAIRNIAGQIVNRDTLSGLILIVENHVTSQALKAVALFSFKVEIFQVCDSISNISHKCSTDWFSFICF